MEEAYLLRSINSGFFSSSPIRAEVLRPSQGRRGNIANMRSAAGHVGMANLASYSVTEEATRAMTRVAAREIRLDGTNVDTICPDIPMMPKSLAETSEDDREPVRRVQLLGSVSALRPLFLVNDASQSVTGHTPMVDGGLHDRGRGLSRRSTVTGGARLVERATSADTLLHCAGLGSQTVRNGRLQGRYDLVEAQAGAQRPEDHVTDDVAGLAR